MIRFLVSLILIAAEIEISGCGNSEHADPPHPNSENPNLPPDDRYYELGISINGQRTTGACISSVTQRRWYTGCVAFLRDSPMHSGTQGIQAGTENPDCQSVQIYLGNDHILYRTAQRVCANNLLRLYPPNSESYYHDFPSPHEGYDGWWLDDDQSTFVVEINENLTVHQQQFENAHLLDAMASIAVPLDEMRDEQNYLSFVQAWDLAFSLSDNGRVDNRFNTLQRHANSTDAFRDLVSYLGGTEFRSLIAAASEEERLQTQLDGLRRLADNATEVGENAGSTLLPLAAFYLSLVEEYRSRNEQEAMVEYLLGLASAVLAQSYSQSFLQNDIGLSVTGDITTNPDNIRVPTADDTAANQSYVGVVRNELLGRLFRFSTN